MKAKEREIKASICKKCKKLFRTSAADRMTKKDDTIFAKEVIDFDLEIVKTTKSEIKGKYKNEFCKCKKTAKKN